MGLYCCDKQIRSEGFIQEPNLISISNSVCLEILPETGHANHGDIGGGRVLK